MSPITAIDLDHVAIAVEDQSVAWPRYAGDLGGEWVAGGNENGFAAAQVKFANGMKVEVLQPFEIERNDFLRRFLDRSGPGPHHLTFKVADIVGALEQADEAGYRPVGVNLSFAEWKEAFLHPKDAPGVVVQLAQSTGSWQSPPPASMPAPRTSTPSTLVHVAHGVADLDEGLRLFAGLLAGSETGRGHDGECRWVDLAWTGPGRVRLIEPLTSSTPLAQWIGDRRGRVHHLAFMTDEPQSIDDAFALDDGFYEVKPEANFGTRLLLVSPGLNPYADRPFG